VLESLGFRWDDRTLTDTTFADRLAALAAREGVDYVDPLPALRAARDDTLYFPIDGHWTPRGHALVAELIATAVVSHLAATHLFANETGAPRHFR
jgi:hypothetical protein